MPPGRSADIDWAEIALLYEGLVRIAPGIGSLVGRAVALAQAGEVVAGFTALEEIAEGRIVDYQPYWAARGHLLRLLDRNEAASKAFTRAASLTDDPAMREYLFKRSAETPIKLAYTKGEVHGGHVSSTH
jgi:predicted RNA polymerase sigma factor